MVPDARERGASIPIAFALVKAIVDHSAALWKLGEADGVKLAPALIELIRREQSVPGHYGLARLPAKSLWPLFHAWHPSTEAFLIEVLAGKLDNGKSLSATQRKTRRECLSWFAEEKKLAKLGAALAKRAR